MSGFDEGARTSSRRGFLRALGTEVRHQVGRFADDQGLAKYAAASAERLPTPHREALPRALPSRGHVTIEELVSIGDAGGLGRRRDAVRALAQPSLRLTLSDTTDRTPQASWLGEPGARPVDLAWSGDQEPRCLAGIDLADAATVLEAGSPLPHDGILWCFVPATLTLTAQYGEPEEIPVAIHRGDPMGSLSHRSETPGARSRWRSIQLSSELQLPRIWSSSVQALDLDTAEHDAWQLVRQRLAERHGVEVHDNTQRFHVMHRLIGYPDERRGEMPLACELLARGHELGGEPPLAHPHVAVAEAYEGRWRLLFQLSLDDELGWAWGGRRERVYVWIDEADLANGDFARVRAFAQ